MKTTSGPLNSSQVQKCAELAQASLKAWMRRVLVNTCIDRLRKYKLKKSKMSGQEPDTINLSTSETAVSNLTYQELLACISKLSPAYQTVFNLFVIDGYTHEEIAAQMHIPLGTVKSNIKRAQSKLKDKLKIALNMKEDVR